MKPSGAVVQQIIMAREKGHQEGRKFAIRNYSAVLLLCLKDKFNFTTEQLQQTSAYINDTFDSVGKGYVTMENISDILKEENDITVTFGGKELQAFDDK